MSPKSSRRWFRECCRADDGASAVEFALFAPILFFSLLGTADLGLALYERMTIDHVLRAGAESAMADQGEPRILHVLETTAAKNFSLSSQTGSSESSLTLSASRYCACPESPGTVVACSTTCPGDEPTQISYRLAGKKTYNGMIIPAINFGPSLEVQIR